MRNCVKSKSIALPRLSPACLKTVLPAFIALFLFTLSTRTLSAQTVIGGDIPDSSAILDLQSTDKGLLIPRMSETQRNAIAGPAMGLIVLNTTNNCLEVNLGTPSSPEWAAVTCRIGSLSAISCSGAVLYGSLEPGAAASGVSVKVPYTGGNGGAHSGQTATSTGVTGLTATLAAGNFATGADSLTYTISGTPSGAGTASFALNIGGQSCTLELTVAVPAPSCWAKVSATDTLFFMCHNLASANTSADPFTPSWEINGGYWQWGRKGPDASLWLNTNTTEFAHGPTGPGAGETNEAVISGWNQTWAPNGAWSDSLKTANDPCPAGYRLPTKAQWDGVLANNTQNLVGTNWAVGATNYSTGRSFGSSLMLPAAGYRNDVVGLLFNRGYVSYYWSSTENGASSGWSLFFSSVVSNTIQYSRKHGYSVRCAAEPVISAGSIGALNCSGGAQTGTLTAGVAASGVSVKVPYTGGNGGTHSGQTATSTGVTGLTATLASGSFATGADSLSYTISGTPSGAGTASFALSIGGQSCTLELTVAASSPPAQSCWAKVSATDTLFFMCHNLASANTSADPFTPSWEINGGYWQWGRKGPDANLWLNNNTPEFAHGPTGPGAGETNEAAISGWNQTWAPNGAWSDASKTADDPCPTGYRLPTQAQWNAVLANNNGNDVGTNWNGSATNYTTGRSFGTALMLPATGQRSLSSGELSGRGAGGSYWSSTVLGTSNAWNLDFGSGFAFLGIYDSRYGFSVRCAAEPVISAGSIGALNCSGGAQTGTLTAGVAASGVSVKVPYTGGNGGTHSGQTATSTGVTGLTATLASGNFATGADSLSYTISGTPSGAGTASFALSIGGQSCTLELTVAASSPPAQSCWAKVSATDTLFFMCHNLASANTSADPFTPSWEINGGYWQWGRKGPDASLWLNTNTTEFAHGPTGPGAGEANETSISGWNQTAAPNGAWADNTKTTDDPCPTGYRVPTTAQWDAVLANNAGSDVGTNWTMNSNTNYSTGRSYGTALMLPAAGFRNDTDGELLFRGDYGYYWSSTGSSTVNAWGLGFSSGGAVTDGGGNRRYGFSVRCVVEPPAGSIGALNCSGGAQTGTLTAGVAASGVSVKVPYTGGNGGTHNGQTATSTGVTGLTATLAAGNFVTGADSLTYTISGTPTAAGTASFALSIGGQNCTLELTVAAPAAPSCWAKVSATDTLFFMCHNLASANTSADPFTPSWEINGGYWQWGRKGPDASLWLNTNTTEFAHGPTGPGAGEANEAAISDWNQTLAPNGAWTDGAKTTEDPCPNDYRVPTKAQWDAVLTNNVVSEIGTNWTADATNYSTGISFGTALMLPAAGYRPDPDGVMFDRGYGGYYWGSTEEGTEDAWHLLFYSGYTDTFYFNRRNGFSVRCVSE
jgi:uncharacterized protein (TIGR02145 family)